MPESLLTWFERFGHDPEAIDARLKGRPVLVYDAPEGAAGTGDSQAYELRTQAGGELDVVSGLDALAVVVEKTKDNAFQRRVSVGRTKNNDIVLSDSSVSRFHAWLQLDDAGTSWVLVDAGSSNGTYLAGKRLPPRSATSLTSGVKLRFGTVALSFYTAEGFVRVLRQETSKLEPEASRK